MTAYTRSFAFDRSVRIYGHIWVDVFLHAHAAFETCSLCAALFLGAVDPLALFCMHARQDLRPQVPSCLLYPNFAGSYQEAFKRPKGVRHRTDPSR